MKKRILLEALLEIFLIISLVFIFSIANSTFVNAEEIAKDTRVCCGKTNDKESKYCQYTDRKNCDSKSPIFDNKCEDVSMCRPVCCNVNKLGYTSNGGQGCFKSVSLDICVNELKGEVIADATCNVPQCKKNCCVIGSQCLLSTEEGCKDLTNVYQDLKLDYRNDISSELECLNVCRSNDQGCCVSGADKNTKLKNKCGYLTFSQCEALSGKFYPKTACDSLPDGNKDCDQCKYKENEKRKIGCNPKSDGGEDVWEFDKCGNPSKVVEDCDYSKGNFCREENGTASCKSLNCESTSLWDNPFVDENLDCPKNPKADDPCWTDDNKVDTKFHGREKSERINGESWCEYDADAGPTRDLPGTRHYVHTCYEGKEMVQECKDYREEFCVQSITGDTDHSACVTNKAAKELCTKCDNNKDCCEKGFNGNCVWIPNGKPTEIVDQKKIGEEQCAESKKHDPNYQCPSIIPQSNPSSNEEKGRCIPLVPPGTKGDDKFCKPGSTTVNPVWMTYGWGSSYHCEGGCDFYTKKFTYNQNNFCRALGDCGADFNLAGEWSNFGLDRKCDRPKIDIKGAVGVASGGTVKDIGYTDYDGVKYDDLGSGVTDAKSFTAEKLVAQCSTQIIDPGNYKGENGAEKPESFLGFSRYSGVLKITAPPELFRDIPEFMQNSVKALYALGGISAGLSIIAAFSLATAFGVSTLSILSVGLSAGLIGGTTAAITTASVAAGVTAGASASVLAGGGAAGAAAAATAAEAVTTATMAGLTASASASASTVWGLIVAAVLIIIAVVFSTTMKVNDESKVEITCKPWTPPEGSKNCNLCHEAGERKYLVDGNLKTEKVDFTAGGLHQCTPYLCWSLGKGCKYTESNEGPKCLPTDCSKDANAPKRSPLADLGKENPNSCVSNIEGNGQDLPCTPVADSVVPDTGHGGYKIAFVKPNTNIKIGINTDELAVCKWDLEKKTKYEDYSKTFDQVEPSKVHTIKLEAGRDLLDGEKKTINVVCKDICQNPISYQSIYTIDIEVAKMKDLGAPAFVSIDPKDGASLKSNLFLNSTSPTLKLNEKAQCKYSMNNDPYDVMKSPTFDCGTSGCSIILTDIKEGENTFYIRCKDKDGNINVDSIPNNNGYKLIRSKPLVIDSIKCKNAFDNNCGTIYDSNFTLEVVTSSGAENGKAVCSATSTNGLFYEFFNTNSSVSTQKIGPRVTGNYTEFIKCEDSVGNEVKGNVSFLMISDEDPPKVLKLGLEGANLNILTNEFAICKYGNSSSLLFNDMIKFENTDGIKHSANIGNSNYLNVKCSDRFNHVNNFDVFKGK